MMGDPGLPDIIATNEARGLVLAWELKGNGGRPTGDQLAWIRGLETAPGVDARVIWPADYDRALSVILGTVDAAPMASSCVVCGGPVTRYLDPSTGRGLCAVHNP